MGNYFSISVGYVFFYYLTISQKLKEYIYPPKKEKTSIWNDSDAILKEDNEQKADILSSEEINKIIKKQQKIKNNTGESLNEYKMIKNVNDYEENDYLTVSIKDNMNKDLKDIKFDIINEKTEDSDCSENIDELKASVMHEGENLLA